MEQYNHLAENLRLYQQMRDETLAEFSAELGIARSTLQSILIDGNTTVDTLIRLHNSMHLSLDELVFGEHTDGASTADIFAAQRWFAELPPEKQNQVMFHLNALYNMTR